MADEVLSETMTLTVPDEPAPAAVVRRRGESRADLRMRGAGIDMGRGGTQSALARAAEMSLKRENLDRQNRAQTLAELQREDSLKRMDLDERQFEHKKTFDILGRDDAQKELNDSVNAAKEVATFDVNDPDFDVKVSETVSRFPMALNNQRFKGMLEHRDKIRFANVQNRLQLERSAFGQNVELQLDENGNPNIGATLKILETSRANREAAAKAALPENAVFAGATVNPKGEVTQRFAPSKEVKGEEPDTYEQFNKDLEAVKKAYGVKVEKKNGKEVVTGQIPSFLQRAFEARGKELEAAVTGKPADAAPAATAPNPNQAALDWLAKNPNDPRAAAIKAKLGVK